ncbi:hypothetical protein GXW79_13105 [Roseomonas arctica]|uniref:THAP4-like heme-binding beta-barrel domain-containing protein n=2 Tax=Plastoroseomonas arctica TaxID=1509237 RepID=A0AAF1JXC2_9PROT|nr:hypothetical protein [Plastoroseomonas arctica]
MSSAKQIGINALKANAALAPLAFLLGEWRTMGTHPGVPGQTLEGRTSFAWHEGGAFLIMRSEVDHPEFPDGVAIFSADRDAGSLAMNWFDERGVSRLYQVTAGDRSMRWHRDDPRLAQRATIVAGGDGDRLVSKGQMSLDGADWSVDLSQIFTRG